MEILQGAPNPYFQSEPGAGLQAIIDPTKINPVAQNYISKGLIPTDPTGAHDYQSALTDNYNELTMKFDFWSPITTSSPSLWEAEGAPVVSV